MIPIILVVATMTTGNHGAITLTGIAMKAVNMQEILLLKEDMEKGISVTIEKEVSTLQECFFKTINLLMDSY